MHPPPEPIETWATARKGSALWLNATAVALDGQGLLVLGAPGAGKSGLALDLMSLGAVLISDDGVWLETTTALLERPAQATGWIEARQIGLIRAGPTLATAPLCLAVDLDRTEAERLPPLRTIALGDRRIPLLHAGGRHRIAPALILMMRHGRAEP
jgi:HPr kinase/phosphorylase